jgi:hypothetical protein
MNSIIRTFIVWTLGLAVPLIPAEYVHSATKKQCEAKGTILCLGTTKCGTQSCVGPGGGGVRPYKPGETYCDPTGKCSMCDGCSGKMVEPERSKEGGGKRPPKFRPEDLPLLERGQSPPSPPATQ